MYTGEIESDSDWSPRRISPIGTLQKKAPEPFLRSQRAVLLRLRQELLDFTFGVTGSCRSDGDTSLAKTHPADAGTAYDRDFALHLLSREHDALCEIDQAPQRIESGTYGICEVSGKLIPHAGRLG